MQLDIEVESHLNYGVLVPREEKGVRKAPVMLRYIAFASRKVTSLRCIGFCLSYKQRANTWSLYLLVLNHSPHSFLLFAVAISTDARA